MAKIKNSQPKVLWNLKSKLGEGTLWVKEHNSIYFVDIKKKRIHILNVKNSKKKTIRINKEIGFKMIMLGAESRFMRNATKEVNALKNGIATSLRK